MEKPPSQENTRVDCECAVDLPPEAALVHPDKMDAVLSALGSPGRHAILQIALIMLNYTCFTLPILSTVFIAYITPHTCARPTNEGEVVDLPQVNVEVDLRVVYKECKIEYRNSSSTVFETNCTNGNNYHGLKQISFVSEWDLVCQQKTPAIYFVHTFMVLGAIVGGTIITSMADRLGRKRLIVASQILLAAVGTACALAPNLWVLIGLRFLSGICQTGGLLVSFTLLMEGVVPTDRRVVGALAGSAFNINVVLLALVAWLMKAMSWRALQLMMAATNITVVLTVWLITESPRWLLVNHKYDQLLAILRTAADRNGVDFDGVRKIVVDDEDATLRESHNTHSIEKIEVSTRFSHTSLKLSEKSHTSSHRSSNTMRSSMISRDMNHNSHTESERVDDISRNLNHNSQAETQRFYDAVLNLNHNSSTPAGRKTKYTLVDIVRHRALWKPTLIMFVVWPTCNFTYYGLFLTSSYLKGDRHLIFFLLGIVDFFGDFCLFSFIERLGRRSICVSALVVAAVGLFTSTVSAAAGAGAVTVLFYVVGKFGIGLCYSVIFVFTAELYPTNVRSAAVGLCSSVANIGGILASFTKPLQTSISWGPGALFSTICVISCILVMMLPETKGRPLPKNMQDVEMWREEIKSRSNETKSLKKGSEGTKSVVQGDDITRSDRQGSGGTRSTGQEGYVAEGSGGAESVAQGSVGTKSVAQGSDGTKSVAQGSE